MLDNTEENAFRDPSISDLAALATCMPDFVVDPHVESRDDMNDDDGTDEAEEAFDFKLFNKTDKVSLAPEQTIQYATPVRPMSYYQHTPTESHLERIQASVMETSDLSAPFHTFRPSNRLLFVPYEPPITTSKRWRPSKARRLKFKALKEEEQRRLASQRKMSRGRGTRGRGTSRIPANRGARPGGYPRKGGPPA